MANDATVGELRVLLTASQTNFEAAMKQAAGQVKALETRLLDLERTGKQSGKGLLGAFSGVPGLGNMLRTALPAAGIAGVGVLVKQFTAASGALVDMSNKTGLSLAALQKFKFGAEQTGSTLEGVVAGVEQMQKRLVGGDKSVVAAYDQLGIKLSEFRALKPEEQFEKLTSAIAGVSDPAQRTALRIATLGKSGNQLTGDFKTLGDEAQRLGLVLGDDVVKSGDELGDNFDKLIAVGKTLVGGVLTPFLPVLNGIASGMVAIVGPLNNIISGFGKFLSPAERWKQLLADINQGLETFGLRAMSLPEVTSQAAAGVKKWNEEIAKRTDLGVVDVLEREDETIRELNDQLKKQQEAQDKATEATKRANDAADKLNASQDALVETMREAGIMTQEVVATGLAPYIQALNLASERGNVQFRRTLIEVEPAIRDMAQAMHDAGEDASWLLAWLEKLRREAGALPQVIESQFVGIGEIIQDSFGDSSRAVEEAMRGIDLRVTGTVGTLTDAFKTLGITSRAELQSIAAKARAAYETIAASLGKHSPEAIAAFKKWEEAAAAAAGNTKRAWGDVFPYLSGIVQTIGAAITGSFAQMLIGAKGFKDGFLDIWNSIKAGIAQILTSILADFTNRFLKGLLAAIAGQKGGFAQAFGGLFNGLGSGAAGAAGAGGAGSGGAGAGAGGAGAGAGGIGMAGGIVAGAGVGAVVGYQVGSRTGNAWGGAGSGAAAGALVGSVAGPIGAGIGAIVGAIAGAIGAQKARMRANDNRDEFIGQFGGSGTGAGSGFQNLAAELTAAGQGPGGGKLFHDLISANDPQEFAEAVQEVVKVLEAYRAKTAEAATAEQEHADKIAEVQSAHEAKMESFRSELKALDDQVAELDASEAVEEEMGVVERAARDAIAQQQEALKSAMEAQQQATTDALDNVRTNCWSTSGEIEEALTDGIGSGVDAGIDKINELARAFEALSDQIAGGGFSGGSGGGYLPGETRVPGFAGGTPGLEAMDFGRGSMVRLHGRESVVPESRAAEFAAKHGGAGTTVNVYVKDELSERSSAMLARQVAPYIPAAVANGGPTMGSWRRMTKSLGER